MKLPGNPYSNPQAWVDEKWMKKITWRLFKYCTIQWNKNNSTIEQTPEPLICRFRYPHYNKHTPLSIHESRQWLQKRGKHIIKDSI